MLHVEKCQWCWQVARDTSDRVDQGPDVHSAGGPVLQSETPDSPLGHGTTVGLGVLATVKPVTMSTHRDLLGFPPRSTVGEHCSAVDTCA